MQTQISDFSLSQDDIDSLSPELRVRLFESIGGSIEGAQVLVVVIQSENSRLANALTNIFETTVKIFNARSKPVSEKNIEKLVDIYLNGEVRSSFDVNLEHDNAAIRANYLRRVPTYNSVQIREWCHKKNRNTSEPASRWKKEGRIFAIRNDGKDWFPSFQFSDGSPKPIVKEILKKLPNEMSSWQIALWFNAPNGWFDGSCPSELLNKPDEVLYAAEQESQEVFG